MWPLSPQIQNPSSAAEMVKCADSAIIRFKPEFWAQQQRISKHETKRAVAFQHWKKTRTRWALTSWGWGCCFQLFLKFKIRWHSLKARPESFLLNTTLCEATFHFFFVFTDAFRHVVATCWPGDRASPLEEHGVVEPHPQTTTTAKGFNPHFWHPNVAREILFNCKMIWQ